MPCRAGTPFAIPDRMRVALLSPLFESVPPRLYGGTERVVYNLCQSLKKLKTEVVLFAAGDSTVDVELVSVVPEAIRLSKVPCTDPVAHHFRMLAMVLERAGDFDVIHNHHDYWMLPLSEMTQTPVLSTLHGRTDLPEINAAYCSYPKGRFVSISQSQRNLLPQLPWVKAIHHGIDLSNFEFYPNPGKYLAFLGRISGEKRPEWAIEIAFRSGVPLKIAAKIEGAAGKDYYARHLKPYVDGKFIEFVGEISEDEKSEFLGNALALVFPIDWPEPFGLVVIESLACGTPVLARPCGAVPEILEDSVTGFIDSDIRKLANRVKDIVSIDRKFCRDWVNQKFSLNRMAEDYIHVYHQVAAQKRRAYTHRRNLLHTIERTSNRNSED